jgi:phage terminase small subunit
VKELSLREEAFAQEYVVDYNATAAMRRIGSSAQNPGVAAGQVLARPWVRRRVEELAGQRYREAGVTSAALVRELARLGFSDVRNLFDPRTGALLEPHLLHPDVSSAIQSIKVVTRDARDENGNRIPERVHEIKLHDKGAALDKLMRFRGLYEADNAQVGQGLADIIRERVRALEEREGLAPGTIEGEVLHQEYGPALDSDPTIDPDPDDDVCDLV